MKYNTIWAPLAPSQVPPIFLFYLCIKCSYLLTFSYEIDKVGTLVKDGNNMAEMMQARRPVE